MTNLYQTALKEHQAGNLDLAEKMYCEILQEDRQNVDVLHLLSILLAQRQEFSPARLLVEQALTLSPDSPTLHNSMGNILNNLKQTEEAIAHYKMALKLQPDNASVHNNLGNVFYGCEKIDEAQKCYVEAIRLRPEYVDAYYNLSLVLIKQGLQSDAKNNLMTVLQLQPEHGCAYGNLAYLLQLQGEFDQALFHYQKSLMFDEDNVLSRHNLGVILTNKGQYAEAIDHFKMVLDLQPEHVETLHNLGAVFLLQRKFSEGLPYFLRLADLVQDFTVYYNLGVIYSELRLFKEAIEYFNRALSIVPDDFAANVNLGAIYLQGNDYKAAEKYYIKAAHSQPGNKEVGYILAAIQQKNALTKAPEEYIRRLFDQYAPYFDRHLEVLEHRAPELLFNAVSSVIGGDQDLGLTVLDLGCGTGMGGARFKTVAKELIGIDLSEKMLAVAKGKNIYTDLRLGALENIINEFFGIDLIIAVDSLVYFGDLQEIFANCFRALRFGGIFAFTVESSDNVYPYVLQRSARFAHSKQYITEMADKNNFVILQSDTIILRKHGNILISGDLFVFKKQNFKLD